MCRNVPPLHNFAPPATLDVEALFGTDRDARGRYGGTDGLRFFTSALGAVLSA